jgi:hypothetical protein
VADFAKVATEVFQILRSFNYTVSMWDDTGTRVAEKEDARRFFAKPANLMVSIVDDDDDSHVDLFYGKSTHANDVKGLIETLRQACTKYGLTFRAQQHGEEIEPKDFSDLAAITERKRNMMTPLTEGMYGTTKSSYLRMENARMIVRHSKRIDDSVIGARGRCVEQIFIENASGERLLFPSTQIAPARAMTQHVSQGGSFGDQIGEQIMEMTHEYANLGQASSFVANNAGTLQEGAMAVREACRGRMRKLRKTFERLSKPTSYVKECAKVTEQANMLAETGEEAIDETRISEIRQLLNDADLPRSVYECACKAMDRMKEDQPITEDDPAPKTVGRPKTKVKAAEKPEEEDDAEAKAEAEDEPKELKTTESVLGRRVDKTAWEEFKNGKLQIKGSPNLTDMPRFTSKYAELCFKLGGLVPLIVNDSLSNLLRFVLDGLQDYTESGGVPLTRPEDERIGGSKNPMGDWRKRFRSMTLIANHALRVAHIPVEKGLAENNTVIQSYMQWLNQFDPDKILSEDFDISGMNIAEPHSRMMGMDMDDDTFDTVLDDAVRDFDPDEFVDSPEMLDVISGRDPKDPEENELTHDEVMDALKSYLEHHITMYSGEYDDGFEGDTTDIADAVYDLACEALQDKGFVVQNHHNEEELTEFADDMDNELTISDIEMPSGSQVNSLVAQTTKQMVKDPDTKGMRKPDSSYVNRLQALGWITTGPNGQSY